MIKEKVKDETISNNKDFYTYYQRPGRQDIVVKIHSDDLRDIKFIIIDKNDL